MSESQFSLAWDSYKSNICGGFSVLQQNGEFVDMTLAADGHLVKVHQVLVALASPYLKDMITSAPCPHPVIYLNNISHKVLSYLLEYIYTGEVMVPCDFLGDFSEAAQALHIKGLENINGTGIDTQPTSKSPYTVSETFSHSVKRKAPPFDMHQVALPSSARKIFIKAEGPIPAKHIQTLEDDLPELSDSMEETPRDMDSFESFEEKVEDQTITSVENEKLKATASNLLFTVSIRGSLQIILNRYIYNMISSTSRSGQRRWRCVEYRNSKCSAFVVTKGNIVLNRANAHTHPFHDKKILAKLEKSAVFSAFEDVQAFKEKDKDADVKVPVPDELVEALVETNK